MDLEFTLSCLSLTKNPKIVINPYSRRKRLFFFFLGKQSLKTIVRIKSGANHLRGHNTKDWKLYIIETQLIGILSARNYAQEMNAETTGVAVESDLNVGLSRGIVDSVNNELPGSVVESVNVKPCRALVESLNVKKSEVLRSW